MCGIAGILSTQLDKQRIAPALEAMQNALNHRGPDGRGDYFSACNQAALAHTRLSIIDLSDNGAQPMHSADGRYVISFNGEIYNYQALRSELQAQGVSFQSQSDTEVILQLYQKLGPACVNKLRGMFAFFIWDSQDQRGFAARDPLGIKPLYYCESKGSIAFASELKAVIASGLSLRQLSHSGLSGYLKRGSVPEPTTLVDDVLMLPAGSTLRWKNGSLQQKTYWQLSFKSQAMSNPKAIAITRNALKNSVQAHFVSDVPVGIFLSGGIDSTALVALASKITNTKINTYSIAFEDPAWNEGDIAKRVAKHFGTNHTELVMTPELAKPLFEQFLSAIDQPTIDGFNTFCVAKLAHDHNEKVVLSGLGGDELFAGYKSFKLIPKMAAVSLASTIISPLAWLTAKLLNRSLSPKAKRIADFIAKPGSLQAAHQSLRSTFSNREANDLAYAITGQQADTNTQPDLVLPEKWADKVSALELSTYMRNQLLRDSDVASMSWGLELRVPLVDQRLIDTVTQIPASIRLQYGKKLLIDAVPEIPDWVVNRPKQGFRFPFDHWFSDSWQTLPQLQNIPPWISLKPWYRRWSLLVLSDWMHRHIK